MRLPTSPQASLQAEERLLLACARWLVTPAATKLPPIDELCWDRLIRLASAHGLLSPLYDFASATNLVLPDRLRQELRFYPVGIGLRNQHAAKELLAILANFQQQDISAIPFKGPTLALMAYGRLDHREFGDLDILVRPEDQGRVRGMLLERGYTLEAEHSWEAHFTARERQLAVDLHWQLTPWHVPLQLDFDTLQAGLKLLTLDGVSVLAPNREDMILTLCAHLVKDQLNINKQFRLIKLVDIAQLIITLKQLDWDRLLTRARQSRCERTLLLGVWLCHELFAIKLPPHLFTKLQRNPLATSFPKQATDWVFRASSVKPSEFEQALFHMRVRDRLRDRLHLILTPTPKDAAPFLPLCYISRPLRLALKYGRILLTRSVA